jgi:O-antigen ligase
MLQILKELVVVLVIAFVVFRLARPVVLLFISQEDFSRRRNVWFALTTVGFLSPNFWLFALIAVPLLFWSGRKDSNPAALYLFLLHVIPPIVIRVPMIGISFLLDIDFYLLLSFCVMTPAALRLFRSKGETRIRGVQAMDLCLLAYGLLTAFLFVHPEIANGTLMVPTFTDDLRRIFVFFFITVVPYFVITRSNSNRQAFSDILASFCLGCGVMAGVAMFESARHWLLYADFDDRWSAVVTFTSYLERGASLRAMASTGHPLSLGYLLAIAFGFWLYLQSHVKSKRMRLAVTVFIWLGLLAAYSRGPWIGAVCIYFVFAALRPRAISTLFKASVMAIFVAFLISLSPLRDKVVSVLPFLGGTIDSENVLYRHRLFDRALEIIGENPLLGDQDALLRMQDLRQGQGIIDLINSYLEILLSSGFVGLSLFLSFILIAVFKAWALSKQAGKIDPDFGMLGACIVACILGTLLMLENGSFGTGSERLFYVLAGLASAYAQLGRSHSGKLFVTPKSTASAARQATYDRP